MGYIVAKDFMAAIKYKWPRYYAISPSGTEYEVTSYYNYDLRLEYFECLFPPVLECRGKLDLTEAHAIKMPSSRLIVHGDLIINEIHGRDLRLPKDTVVKGSLYARNYQCDSLPDNLYVGHTLTLDHSGIRALGKNTTIGVDLFLHRAAIQYLPEDLNVGGFIFCARSQLIRSKVPRHLQQKCNWR